MTNHNTIDEYANRLESLSYVECKEEHDKNSRNLDTMMRLGLASFEESEVEGIFSKWEASRCALELAAQRVDQLAAMLLPAVNLCKDPSWRTRLDRD